MDLIKEFDDMRASAERVREQVLYVAIHTSQSHYPLELAMRIEREAERALSALKDLEECRVIVLASMRLLSGRARR